MRKGIHSLYHLIKTTGKLDALSGDGYVFIGRTRKSFKVLRWHKEGFVLYNKKLELGSYSLPRQVGDASFLEIENSILGQMVNTIKQKSNSNELRQKAILSTWFICQNGSRSKTVFTNYLPNNYKQGLPCL